MKYLSYCGLAMVALLSFITSPAAAEWSSRQGFKPNNASDKMPAAVGVGELNEVSTGNDPIELLVAQLRGEIVGITRSGKVVELTVDEDVYRPVRELPHFDGETGQTGLCISPDDKYVFTTSVAKSGWERTNRIVRWNLKKSSEGTISLERDAVFNEIFEDAPAKNAHQIGHCLIDSKGHLWVGTGDGHNPALSHDITHANGKILRMQQDFSAVTANPFFDPANPKSVRSYVYASGFRNPFSLAEGPGGRMFVADNGPMFDRMVELQKGRDYLWDNTDESMTFNNLAVFPQQYGPSGLVYVPSDHPGAGELAGHLVMTASHKTMVLAFPYQAGYGITDRSKVLIEPQQKSDKRTQDFSGLTLTKRGLVVSHIRMAEKTGLVPMPLLRIEQGEGSERVVTGLDLVVQSGCRGCHVVDGVGSALGPNLDNIVLTLRNRLNDQAYLASLADHPGNDDYADLRRDLQAKKGSVDERIEQWLHAKIEHPTFDNPSASMAKLELPQATRDQIVAYMLSEGSPQAAYEGEPGWYRQLRFKLAQNPRIPLALTLVFGIGLGVFFRKLSLGVTGLVRRFKP